VATGTEPKPVEQDARRSRLKRAHGDKRGQADGKIRKRFVGSSGSPKKHKEEGLCASLFEVGGDKIRV
jgi:hypothetical protein